MEINLTNVLLIHKKELLIFIMRTFILLFCTTVFSFTSENVFSQNAKIEISADIVLTIDEVFDLIKEQTDYTFIYKSDLFRNGASKVTLKKRDHSKGQYSYCKPKSYHMAIFRYEFSDDQTIVLKNEHEEIESPLQVQQQTVSGKVIAVRNGESGLARRDGHRKRHK